MILEKAVTSSSDPRDRIFMAGTAKELGIRNVEPKTPVLTHATILFHHEGTNSMLVNIDKIGNEESVFTSMKWIPGLI